MNKLQTGWLYTLTGAVSAVSLAACMPASKPYNIVYIMTDDHTAQMMSCYDNRYIETPNLDRIANDGVRFVNSFVANSLSGPSRANRNALQCLAILKGRAPYINDSFRKNYSFY